MFDYIFDYNSPLCNLCICEYRRGGLVSALGGRDDRSLMPILTFLARNINDPVYSEVLIEVTNILLGN